MWKLYYDHGEDNYKNFITFSLTEQSVNVARNNKKLENSTNRSTLMNHFVNYYESKKITVNVNGQVFPNFYTE